MLDSKVAKVLCRATDSVITRKRGQLKEMKSFTLGCFRPLAYYNKWVWDKILSRSQWTARFSVLV